MLFPELVERVTSIYKREEPLQLVEELPREDILGLPKLSEETELVPEEWEALDTSTDTRRTDTDKELKPQKRTKPLELIMASFEMLKRLRF